MTDYTAATYGDRIAEVYDELYGFAAETDAAVELLAELAGGGPVLELGIGTGRLALPLSRRGLPVAGIDASEAMVAKLRDKAGGDAIALTIGDFADVAVDGPFRLIAVVFNTFFALLTQDDQLRCMTNAAARLEPGGPLPERRPSSPTWPGSTGASGRRASGSAPTWSSSRCRRTTSAASTSPRRTSCCGSPAPRSSPSRSATAGPASWTSWPAWPGSSSSTDGPTGGARPSPRPAPATSPSGDVRDLRRAPGAAGSVAGVTTTDQREWVRADPEVERIELDPSSWVDVVRGLVPRADEVHDELVATVPWQPSRVFRYERWIDEPRLFCWQSGSGRHPALAETQAWISRRYRSLFDGVAVTLYRDEHDGVGFHRDRELRWLEDTIIGVLSMGAQRPWLMRPLTGHKADSDDLTGVIDLSPASGDLLVMGGRCQAAWLHAVPQTRGRVRSRVSAQWRWTSRRGRRDPNPSFYAPRHFSR